MHPDRFFRQFFALFLLLLATPVVAADKSFFEFSACTTPVTEATDVVLLGQSGAVKKCTLAEIAAGDALLAGRAGGQTIYGGTASGDDLLLYANSSAAAMPMIKIHDDGSEGISIRPQGLSNLAYSTEFYDESAGDGNQYLLFEGGTDDTYSTNFKIINATGADRVVTFPNADSATLQDGDRGDITVGTQATTMEIDANAVGAAELAADAVDEAALKAVDSPTDEDVLTYESTTGDFEWAVAQKYHGVSAYNSAAQSVATGTSLVTLTADSETRDSDTYHSTSSNTARITIDSTMVGPHTFSCNVFFAGSATGSRLMSIRHYNSAGSAQASVCTNGPIVGNSGNNTIPCSGQNRTEIASGDYFQCEAWQSSGGNLDITLSHFDAVLEGI